MCQDYFLAPQANVNHIKTIIGVKDCFICIHSEARLQLHTGIMI
jgi:hypothetical protein